MSAPGGIEFSVQSMKKFLLFAILTLDSSKIRIFSRRLRSLSETPHSINAFSSPAIRVNAVDA